MEKWQRFPVIYEINTKLWLNDLSVKEKHQVTLGSVPDDELKRIADLKFDGVWLMGIWERSPGARKVALEDPALQNAYKNALPDYTTEDVVASPYAVFRYEIDSGLGGGQGLASFRQRMEKLGLRIILDFVPNHTAVDHPRGSEHPDRFVQAGPAELQKQPQNYFTAYADGKQRIFAHGRDPYFPSWADTAQLDYRHAETRQAMAEVLEKIATLCDGVRCDMAMLVMHDVFLRTWGGEFDEAAAEFWPAAIRQVKEHHPDFLLMAEIYWDLEFKAQQQGFDYVYDKRLYDRLRGGDAGQVRAHLQASMEYQSHLARFIENHDEQRAASVFGPRSEMAAAVTFAAPGLRLIHEGQIEGRRIKTPVQLGRRRSEDVRPEAVKFYQKLLGALADPVFHDGDWRLLDIREAWPGNGSYRNFISYQWTQKGKWRLLAANLGGQQAQCYVTLDIPELAGSSWELQDLLREIRYERNGDDLLQHGLYLDMPGYQYHLFSVSLRSKLTPALGR